MRTLISTTLLIMGMMTMVMANNNPVHGGEIDLAASTVNWTGKKVSGEHSGTVALKSGELKFENHKLVGGSFTIDMTTITCTDLDGEWGAKLVGHLNNEDFFETAKFPTATFTITEAQQGEQASDYAITGNLTIKGITKVVGFTAVVNNNSAQALITIDRTLYDIKYGSGSFFDNLGDKAIDNKFTLDVNLVTK